MNEADLIQKLVDGIGNKGCDGRVYIEDTQGVRKSAANLGYDGVGDVVINFNGRFK